MRVLIADDDKEFGGFLKQGLSREGYTVDLAYDGLEALELSRSHSYGVILSDVRMPHMNGCDFLKALRQEGYSGPLLMMSLSGDEDIKISSLTGGADDFLSKPFSLAELVARIRLALRKSSEISTRNSSLLRINDLQIDLVERRVKRRGKEIHLTRKEFELLEYFMRHPGRVLSDSALAEQVWNIDFQIRHTAVRSHIKRLRSKLAHSCRENMIQTVRGWGYRFLI